MSNATINMEERESLQVGIAYGDIRYAPQIADAVNRWSWDAQEEYGKDSVLTVNGQPIAGPTEPVLSLGALEAKFRAFGWDVLHANGADIAEMVAVLKKAKDEHTGKGKPVVILMKTEMGAGVDFMVGTHKWHGVAPNDEQLAKAFDRKVYLPSGGSLVIDRTEAMVVIDVNTGKFIGKGGNLEETVTKNNIEAAEEIARQLRLRDLGGIVVIDFIDMALESNRDQVLRRLVECLGRDRTKHQVAEVTSLGLVQLTRKRIGQGLIEAFSTSCESCNGRGIHIHTEPVRAKAATPVFAGHHDDHEADGDSEESNSDIEELREEKRGIKPRKRRRAVSTGVVHT